MKQDFCNGQYPKCSNCVKASAECVDGESVRLHSIPRDRTVQRLRSRVTWLESIIRERLPDVDLSSNESSGAHETIGDEEDAQTQGRVGNGTPPMQRAQSVEPTLDQMGATPIPPDQRAHEIGLISVGVNSDQRYIGPSSGYFLARLVLACSPRANPGQNPGPRPPTHMAQSTINELVTAAQGPLPLPAHSIGVQLCDAFFETVHPQYPILHEPSFRQTLEQVYRNNDQPVEGTQRDAYAHFQVYMVLAISSTILSFRTKRQIPGESYCLSALQYFDRLDAETSLSGLQCLLLLLIFTLHSPNMRLNVWYLNYQCLAAVLDLGLQRHVTTAMGVSLLEQEMRTRIFWVVFAIDRTIATMMGRPIGLRDEACELRLPQNLNDHDLINITNPQHNAPSSIAFSIHLFKLARLISEIKYVANSIVREAPAYAYPTIVDVSAWQRNILEQLDQWSIAIPTDPRLRYIHTMCWLRYHSAKMLLLRPSPAIPKPPTDILLVCHESARQSIRLYNQLYKEDLLVHDWTALHGIILSTVTILYCTRIVPEVAQKTELEDLMADMSASMSILSAAGEHWPSAKRSRDVLEELGRTTIRWLKEMQNARPAGTVHGRIRIDGNENLDPMLGIVSPGSLGFSGNIDPGMRMNTSIWGDASLQQWAPSEIVNLDDIILNLFDGFIPMETYDGAPEFFGP
ncbi:hypothetical protein IQ07DRAFT_614179 [Pyrenochaeta sp. DS3sAY3a]|nr:hypothetical protein IQ07DRAFT_614179 [Pyrenochaeta sp. DS3sAY3a]